MTNAFGLYVHIPFCVHKCSYCDFYSFTKYTEEDFRVLKNGILTELRTVAANLLQRKVNPRAVTSIFFGGGTPSLFPVPFTQEIIEEIRRLFGLATDVEITLEANPETVSVEFAQRLVGESEVNRVSLGAQSFQPEFLSALERMGSKESISQAVARLKSAGIENLNMDLIIAMPGQSPEQLEMDLAEAFSLSPDHLSAYNLSLKPGHPLFKSLPDGDLGAELYELAHRRIEQAGYQRYEISNFSKPNKECAHNLLYWTGADFLGVGPSAASRFFWDGIFHHRKQISDLKKYLQVVEASPVFEVTTQKQTVLEATFLELRTRWGISLPDFRERYHYDPTSAEKFKLLLNNGLLRQDGTTLSLTEKGFLLADGITQALT